MKKQHQYYYCILTTLLGFAFCATAFGQRLSSQDTPVDIGSIPTCDVTAPEGGQYIFSQLHASLFQSQQTTSLPEITKTWIVNCTDSAMLQVRFQDNQQSSAPVSDATGTLFGLGFVNNTGRLGYYQLTLSEPEVDSNKVSLYQLEGERIQDKKSAKYTVQQGKGYGWTENGIDPLSGKMFSVNIAVSPVLNSLQLTQGPLVNGAELDGQAELYFSFGI